MTTLFDYSDIGSQSALEVPKPLVDKYQPQRVEDFLCERPRKIMTGFLRNPFPTAFFFLGGSGTGKTTMALALGKQLPAELHHIASKECNLETVQDIAKRCHYMPRMATDWKPCKMHMVLVDEADQMSGAAALAFLSLLDATRWPPNTMFVFTGNSRDGLEDRFMSRVKLVEFSSYGLNNAIAALLARVWAIEAGSAPAPNFARIVKDSKNNVRDALNTLEVELMAAEHDEPLSDAGALQSIGLLPVSC
jgi:replication-associated recombination protein RarA